MGLTEEVSSRSVRLGAAHASVSPAFLVPAGSKPDRGVRYHQLTELQPLATSVRRKHTRLDKQILERQVHICKAFANITRLQMLDLLNEGEWAAADLQHALGITKPNLSQHLAILKASGIVSTRREGRNIYCSLGMPEVRKVCHQLRDVLRAQIRKGSDLRL
jgi:DNA-binding transcriptional ArsR family regulator